jgi:hypothetical protein
MPSPGPNAMALAVMGSGAEMQAGSVGVNVVSMTDLATHGI